MTNLVIDIGNSRVKTALFNDREMIRTGTFTEAGPDTIAAFLSGITVDFTILSSVNPQPALENYLLGYPNFIRFHSGLKSGIRNNYKTPETLGPDRLAAVIGAAALYPGNDLLIIDAGSCITFDLIDREQNYYGGCISPGLNMRFEALHHYTRKLPLTLPDGQFTGLYGDDTRSAIVSGVQQGLIYEILAHVQAFTALYPELQVVLCGGDASFFESRLKISIFAPIVKTEPDLILTGLNEVIFQYND